MSLTASPAAANPSRDPTGGGGGRSSAGSVVPEPVSHSAWTVPGVVVQQQRDEHEARTGSDAGPGGGQLRKGEPQPCAGAHAAQEGNCTDGASIEGRKWTQHERPPGESGSARARSWTVAFAKMPGWASIQTSARSVCNRTCLTLTEPS